MKAESFAYWLQGFAELHQGAPTDGQWQVIKDHLAEVFDKQTPDRAQAAPATGQRLGEIRDLLGPSKLNRVRDRLIC